jgi:hypothetical protein
MLYCGFGFAIVGGGIAGEGLRGEGSFGDLNRLYENRHSQNNVKKRNNVI